MKGLTKNTTIVRIVSCSSVRMSCIRHYLETIETLSRRSSISGSFFLSSTLGEAKLKAFLTLSRTLCPVVCVWSTIVVLLYTFSPRSPNDLYEAPIPAGMAKFSLPLVRPRWMPTHSDDLLGRRLRRESRPPLRWIYLWRFSWPNASSA